MDEGMIMAPEISPKSSAFIDILLDLSANLLADDALGDSL
jgi:hypothetical protein